MSLLPRKPPARNSTVWQQVKSSGRFRCVSVLLWIRGQSPARHDPPAKRFARMQGLLLVGNRSYRPYRRGELQFRNSFPARLTGSLTPRREEYRDDPASCITSVPGGLALRRTRILSLESTRISV